MAMVHAGGSGGGGGPPGGIPPLDASWLVNFMKAKSKKKKAKKNTKQEKKMKKMLQKLFQNTASSSSQSSEDDDMEGIAKNLVQAGLTRLKKPSAKPKQKPVDTTEQSEEEDEEEEEDQQQDYRIIQDGPSMMKAFEKERDKEKAALAKSQKPHDEKPADDANAPQDAAQPDDGSSKAVAVLPGPGNPFYDQKQSWGGGQWQQDKPGKQHQATQQTWKQEVKAATRNYRGMRQCFECHKWRYINWIHGCRNPECACHPEKRWQLFQSLNNVELPQEILDASAKPPVADAAVPGNAAVPADDGKEAGKGKAAASAKELSTSSVWGEPAAAEADVDAADEEDEEPVAPKKKVTKKSKDKSKK